jgi:Bacterial Ig-like domain
MYGRFARRFDHASGKDAMYFDIDDRFFGGQALNAGYPVTFRVVYLDQGTGSFALKYDAVGDPEKTAFTVTKTNSGQWKEKTVTVSDGYLFNRISVPSSVAPGATADLMLVNTDAENDTFHMIEVTREFGATPPPDDTTPPTVVSTVPTAGATRVAATTDVTATFSEEMMASSINGNTYKLTKKGSSTKISAAVSYSASTDTATLDPANSLRSGVSYKAVVTTGAKDSVGNPLTQQYSWTFKVR